MAKLATVDLFELLKHAAENPRPDDGKRFRSCPHGADNGCAAINEISTAQCYRCGEALETLTADEYDRRQAEGARILQTWLPKGPPPWDTA